MNEVKKEKIPLALKSATRIYDIAKRAYDGETYESIGVSYGISRQRVDSILTGLYRSYTQRKISTERKCK